MKERKVRKGEILQLKGERNSKVYEVVSGLLRSYAVNQKGKKHIFMFAPEGWIIADASLPENPCELYIDALEDSVVRYSEKKTSQIKDVDSLIRRILTLQNRVIRLMSATTIERYDHFIETYPNISQRVPQKMIASYLGVTPEALSKAKGDRLRKK